ncbi:PAAR domain-containing protein [Pseudomonas sp. PDM15]|uniref:PAAR domain-containing protein n=1 Tax=Pseudomonas sp. PDM15 TaxID=2769303 RepID=UPI00177F0048|nr:PAAR domain-containing protein [Pseudomonas sp. PDM15]MBD9426388.1 PAAR domain-containing protein [Pseudomonas sp. PDM15]
MGKPAARVSDTDACPIPGHGPNPVSAGSPNVLINNLPSARVGDPTACGDAIAVGIPTILVNGKPIAHLGSSTAHGGVIVTGSGNVLLGNSGGGAAMSPVSPLQLTGSAAVTATAMTTPAKAAAPSNAVPPPSGAATQSPLDAASKILSDFQKASNTDRVFNDVAHPMGTPADPFEKEKVLEQLRVRVARAHGQNLASTMRVSSFPQQDEASLCGPAAFFYALLMDRPDLYSQAIIELWEKGETNIGQLHIKPSHDCRNPKNFSRHAGGDRIIAIDWISLASLCDSENTFLDYDSPDDQAAGITLPGTLESWFVRAGASLVFDNIQLGSIGQTQLLDLFSFLDQQHHVVSLVSASMVEGGMGIGKNHWIVWEGPPKTSAGEVTATTNLEEEITGSNLFSWGSLSHQITRGFTLKKLLGDMFGGKVFSRIP